MNIKSILLSLLFLLPTTSRIYAKDGISLILGLVIGAGAMYMYQGSTANKDKKQSDSDAATAEDIFAAIDHLDHISQKPNSNPHNSADKDIVIRKRQQDLKDRTGVYCGKERVFFDGEEDESVCEQFKGREKAKTNCEI